MDVGASAVPRGERLHTFAPSMSHSTTDPENVPSRTDEVSRLEEVHQRMKEQQEAWRVLAKELDIRAQ